jgi:large subunit ribosomal protein L10
MPRPEKVQAVADIKERLEDSAAVFLAEYAGLSVAEQQDLRRGLRAVDGEFQVVKMTLARIAATELGYDSIVEDLTGPTGLAFAGGDAAAAAKALKDFAKDHDQLVLKGGLLDGEALTAERVAQLADLDSREVLLAKIAGAFQAPMANMAGLMAAMPRNMASMMSQLIDQLPPAEAPAEEPEAADAPDTDEAAAEPEAVTEDTTEDAVEEAAPEGSDDDAATEAESEDGSDDEATTDEDTADAAEEE